jgi:3-dehydro-L-gulonate-6-phosphate decarboxylase
MQPDRKQADVQKPLLQLALDYIDLPPALAMAYLVHREVDLIEVGTPLCKAEGMRAVAAIRALCPDSLIVADMKTPDVGALEAKIAFDAGANWMTVIGCAPLITVRQAVEEARARGNHAALIELTGLSDIAERAAGWREAGVERVVYHRGWDEGNLTGRLWGDADMDVIASLDGMGFRVSVAGGLGLDLIPRFQGVPVSVFIIGRAIRETPDPAGMARTFREAIAALG